MNSFQDFFQFGDAQWRILAYVVVSMFLGALIGWERETLNKPAGLRTHMLVSGAAALLVALGDLIVTHFGRDLGSPLVQTDPIRLVQAVITGVSFLGAGTIIRGQSDGHVEGLTTAASLLFRDDRHCRCVVAGGSGVRGDGARFGYVARNGSAANVDSKRFRGEQ